MQHQFNVIKDCCELTLTHDLTQEGPTILAGKYYRMDALTLNTPLSLILTILQYEILEKLVDVLNDKGRGRLMPPK